MLLNNKTVMTRAIDGKLGERDTGLVVSWSLFGVGAVPLVVLGALYKPKFAHKPWLKCAWTSNPYKEMFAPLGVWTALALASAILYTFCYRDIPPQPDFVKKNES
jgi:hypothetical protein